MVLQNPVFFFFFRPGGPRSGKWGILEGFGVQNGTIWSHFRMDVCDLLDGIWEDSRIGGMDLRIFMEQFGHIFGWIFCDFWMELEKTPQNNMTLRIAAVTARCLVQRRARSQVCCGGAPRSVLNPPQHLRCCCGVLKTAHPMSKVYDRGGRLCRRPFIPEPLFGSKIPSENEVCKSLTFGCHSGPHGVCGVHSGGTLGVLGGPFEHPGGVFCFDFLMFLRIRVGSVLEEGFGMLFGAL